LKERKKERALNNNKMEVVVENKVKRFKRKPDPPISSSPLCKNLLSLCQRIQEEEDGIFGLYKGISGCCCESKIQRIIYAKNTEEYRIIQAMFQEERSFGTCIFCEMILWYVELYKRQFQRTSKSKKLKITIDK
jgi:hypothetical protein